MKDSYVGDVTATELMDTLYKVAPECTSCMGRKLYFCIEKCCIGEELICLPCNQNNPNSKHFCHRKNELRMLFVNNKIFISRSQWLADEGKGIV